MASAEIVAAPAPDAAPAPASAVRAPGCGSSRSLVFAMVVLGGARG